MKIAIIGSRDYKNLDIVKYHVLRLWAEFHDELVIISGGAKGVDTAAAEEAHKLGVKTIIYPVDMNDCPYGYDDFELRRKWYGRKAYERNQKIVDEAEIIYAFWNRTSKGTLNTIKRAHKAKKQVEIFYEDV